MEYISKEAALNFEMEVAANMDEIQAITQGMSLYADYIKSIPTADVVEVVRCNDCKHSDTFAPNCTEATFPLKCLSIRYGGVYPNWFCEHGERK